MSRTPSHTAVSDGQEGLSQGPTLPVSGKVESFLMSVQSAKLTFSTRSGSVQSVETVGNSEGTNTSNGTETSGASQTPSCRFGMTIWCLASFFVFGIWQQKFGTYYTFIVEMIRAFLLSLSSIISSRFLFPRALAGSLASFDTSSIVNTEGVPLLEENEFETEGSGNSVRIKKVP